MDTPPIEPGDPPRRFAPDTPTRLPPLILTDEGEKQPRDVLLGAAVSDVRTYERVSRALIDELMTADSPRVDLVVGQLRAVGVLFGPREGPWFVTDGGLVYR